MTTQEILDELNEQADGGDEILLADGFEEALIGTVFGACRQPVACYDYDKCAQILVKRDGMDLDEAYEFLDFNTIGAYVGVGTPLFIRDLRAHEPRED
jgi:hypothetical protein